MKVLEANLEKGIGAGEDCLLAASVLALVFALDDIEFSFAFKEKSLELVVMGLVAAAVSLEEYKRTSSRDILWANCGPSVLDLHSSARCRILASSNF